MKKIIAAGHICIDMTPVFPDRSYSRIDEIIVPGRLLDVGKLAVHPGGSVSNTGLAMRFFGADTVLMGKIGDDETGAMLLKALGEKKDSPGMVIDPDAETGYTIVLAIPGIDRVFLHHRGANNFFTADDIDYDLCREAGLFHFGYPTVMRGMYRDGGCELKKMYERVKACGCITSLDLAAMDEGSDAVAEDWNQIFKETLPYVDFFVPSFEELCFAIDRDRYRRLQKEAGGQDMTDLISVKEDVAPLAESLLEMGCKFVMIKCGAPGFYYRSAGKEAFAELEKETGTDLSGFAGQEGFERSYVPERIVSATGAGDTTIGAFLTAMMEGYPFEKCVHLAAAAGASCVEAVDSLGGLKPFAELERKIDAGWKKNGE